ncbi:hypothetical protein KKI24_01620 [bacterium]|nr:hypothetical protein [bacterium]
MQFLLRFWRVFLYSDNDHGQLYPNSPATMEIGLYEKRSPQRHGDHEGKQAELSDCHRAVSIAWSSFLDDPGDMER